MEKDWKGYKLIAVEFTTWVDENCVQSVKGYFLRDGISEYDDTEYEFDELYDYWIENIVLPQLPEQSRNDYLKSIK